MSKEKQEELLEGIKKRLNVLIALAINKDLKEDKSLTKKTIIKSLNSMGLKYTDIAEILGKSTSYITSELSIAKKGGRRK